jgi:hypothetical protein
VKIKSVCKVDMFDEENSEDKHALLDKVNIDCENVLDRLVRAN